MSTVLNQQEAVSPDRWLGVYHDLPFEDYQRAPGMNKSGLEDFRQSPLHYITKKRNPKPATPAMITGRAFHTLALEPDKFKLEYIQDKFSGSFSKEAKAWRDEQHASGLITISAKPDTRKGIWGASEWDELHLMRDAVMAHPIAGLLIQGVHEISFWWIDTKMQADENPGTGKLCKGRADVWNPDHELLVDLKTTGDASYSGFSRSVHDYTYFIQDPFYTDGWQQSGGGTAQAFVFIAVEKEPPYAVGVYSLEPEWRRVGREIYRRTLELYKECHNTDVWQCYPTEVRDLVMPGYARFHKVS